MRTVLISALAILAVSLTACGERCTTCTYSYEALGQTLEVTDNEVCGTRSEIDEYKEDLEETAESVSSQVSGQNLVITCVDN